ncbi:MAG: tetratricopeptide repeat protein [Myxococcales bacterium]|nr:tetratricopeptide repeat protein [Myxococcales bacterium]
MRIIAATLALLLAAAVVEAPSAAAAPSKKRRAKALFKRGEQAFAARNYQRALRLYLKAFELRQLNGFHFNIGLCYRKLGKYSKAISHLTSFIEGSTSPELRRRARRLIKLSEDDQRAGRPGEAQQQQRDDPPKGSDLTAKGAAPDRPPVDDGRRVPVDDGRDGDGAGGDRKRRKGWHPALFFAGLGLTVALVGVGSVTGALALDKSERYKDLNTPDDEARDLRDVGEKLKIVSTVTFIAAGVFAAGTLAAFIATDFSGSDRKVSAVPTVGGVFVSYGQRF